MSPLSTSPDHPISHQPTGAAQAGNAEWLVTDPAGLFAMGTRSGIRERKYHGFCLGIPSRTETSFLADLEIECQGQSLWPHAYTGPSEPVIHPAPTGVFESHGTSRLGPRWRWSLPGGELLFSVQSGYPSGIRLSFRWETPKRGGKPALIKLRPFFAVRNLHANGGAEWRMELAPGAHRGQIASEEAVHFPFDLYFERDSARWVAEPIWYKNFLYPEEARRGYLATEDLFTAGYFEIELNREEAFTWALGEQALNQESATTPAVYPIEVVKRPYVMDFVLREPAGIVAGYPWFGEWGRDTFVSLPGIAMRWFETRGADPTEVAAWTSEVLSRWGEWIKRSGMLPNLIEAGGTHQWDSADATLWWCHSLAALWMHSLARPKFCSGLQNQFSEQLSQAIASIREGRHVFLREREDGLLEVTEAHSTWMDARIDAAAVTPRQGVLPEINALWFQARCLQWLWSDPSGLTAASAAAGSGEGDFSELEKLGRLVLDSELCQEKGRPNRIFVHSIPLAPSFVLQESERLVADLKALASDLWTPVGLRTLRPGDSQYRPRCVGTQRERDEAYHQGPPWAWLGGHYEMARNRVLDVHPDETELKPMLTAEARATFPIEGHVPELFDAEAPFTPRGAPAQAWSLACAEEAELRRKTRSDMKLTQILARRWMSRGERTTNETAKRRPRVASRSRARPKETEI